MDFILLIVPILLVVAVAIAMTRKGGFFGLGRCKAPKADHRTRQDRAVWAWAKVLSARPGPVSALKVARVEMDLEVHLPGSEPYPAATAWLVDAEALEYVEVGKEVPAKIDPAEPQYVYPNGRWAKFAE